MKYYLGNIALFILCMPHFLMGQKNTSVLKGGEWFKIAVMESGCYKIDAGFLDHLGVDVSSVDPSKIALYGNGYNGMLPQLNSADRPDDLIENALQTSGLSDGSFDDEDYLLFYGKSSHHVGFDTESADFYFEQNLYSDTSFYFLTIKKEAAFRMEVANNETTASSYSTSYLKFTSHELEENNLLNSGRNWYGEKVNNSTKSVDVLFENLDIVNETNLKLYTSVISTATVPSSYQISLNGSLLETIDMKKVPDRDYDNKADTQYDTLFVNSGELANTSDGFELTYEFSVSPGAHANVKGYVDYAHVVSNSHMSVERNAIIFYRESDTQAFQISHSDVSTDVWDITEPTNPIIQRVSLMDDHLTFEPTAMATKFIAFKKGQEKTPLFVKKISNQNLHGLSAADVIYITHRNFRSEANRLANFRTAHSGLLSEVVTVDEIYNEYSSGRQDITAIRDFIKHQYNKRGRRLKYVTLFGDCSFDYKKREIINTNYVPIYEARNSIHEINSYSSDDFYGFLEEDEGEWLENENGDHTLEIGIGRVPVQTTTQAKEYVDKVIRYQTYTSAFGKWRNKIAFVADDGDSNTHQGHANSMANYVNNTQSVFNIDKIYLDTYDQVDLPNKQESPEASQAFLDAFSNGNLIVNYTGHGNEVELTHESIFTREMISNLSNRLFMPFFVTATCQFGKYDDPTRTSGGEEILLKAQGGAIGLLASTRPVYASTNFVINEAFYIAAMTKKNDQYRRLGDIIKDTKNNSLEGSRNRNYALLGDASMKLAFPNNHIDLVRINGKPINELDTLKALGKYRLEGQILSNGILNNNFNGSVSVSVYDKPTLFKTLGDEAVSKIYEKQDVLLFQGESTVIEGKFKTEFIVPKNINYSFSKGKIGFYAINGVKNLDAHGAFSEVIVGGSTIDFEEDRKPPSVELFLGDTDFQSGQTVGSSSILLAKLFDKSGINISKYGFGNDIRMSLDGQESVLLNEYYSASIDTYQEGWVTFPMDNLEKGRHSLELTVYDIHNNRSEAFIEFIVSESNGIKLSQVSNYPNPMTNETNFTFIHDRPSEELEIFISITNFSGQVIMNNKYRFVDSSAKIDAIHWNGLDASGNKLSNGIYIYKIIVQSEVDGAKTEAYRKLVILN